MLFEWDPMKARMNLEKHGISFDEASTAFQDLLSLTIPDPLHSEGEERFVLLGYSHLDRLLVVVHTEQQDRIRIISARRATRKEALSYEENR
ncbi:MAG: BrnT family toxin [Vulcanimicrobiota bacterium]